MRRDAVSEPTEGMGLTRFAALPVLAIAAATSLAMVVSAGRYGYHRDELYYLAGGRRLGWGFVDHPPLVPALVRIVDEVSGGSLVGIRAIGAMTTAALIVIGALMAREFGATRRQQILTAIAVVAAPTFRATQVLVGTTGLDQLVWALVLLVAIRMLRTDDPRWWPVLGAVVGIGLETKWLVLLVAGGIAVGVLVGRRWKLVRSAWLAVGGLIALVLWLPNLIWNAQHDWATVDFQLGVRSDQAALGARLEFVLGQLLITGVVGIAIWWPGLSWLLRRDASPRSPSVRPIGIAALVIFGVLVAAGAKLYYPAPVYLPLLAAGVVALCAAGRERRVIWVAVAMFVLTLPLSAPILGTSELGLIQPVNKEFGEMVGWPELATQAVDAYLGLPEEQRETTVIITGNYGEAGAIELFAPEVDVYSSHNSYWWWDVPPDETTAAVLVGYPVEVAEGFCREIDELDTIENDADLQNEEAGRPILLCDLDGPMAELWPDLRHYD